MGDLNPHKLHVKFQQGTPVRELVLPRRYTLTHSDRTGELFLTIGAKYDRGQVSGWYTRLMRDEVLAEWQGDGQDVSLHVFCHVSGGLVFGSARWRNDILHHHMRMVLEAFRFGDAELIHSQPLLDRAAVHVHFRSNQDRYNRIESWGTLQTFA